MVRGHKCRVVNEADGGAAEDELITAEDLLGGALAFGIHPELGAIGFLCLRSDTGVLFSVIKSLSEISAS